jgi:DNA-directed RNA polymerase subunit RPC12/RpoP
VCEEDLESVSSLHYHQMCYHTTEELSLAVLTLKGHKLLAQDLEEAPDSEDAVLCTGLAKYPHFLLNKNSGSVGSDSESTATAESSKLQGAISTLDGESITVPVVKICHRTAASSEESLNTHSALSEDSNVTPLRSRRGQNTKLVVRKRNPKDTALFKKCSNHSVRRKKSVASSRRSLPKCLDQNVEDLILSCHSDDIKTVSSKDENSSGTDTDETLKRRASELSSSVDSCFSQTKDKSCDAFSAIFIKSDIEPSVMGTVASQNVTSDTECTNQTDNQCTDSPKAEGHSPTHKLSSCSSPSSVGSLRSPDNSPHPERYIKAIISRLPNIITADSDQNSNVKSQGRRTSRKKQRTPRKCVNDKYVLPSPLSKHHRSSVLYDYSNKQCSSMQFQDCFVPSVKLGSGIDAECGTSPLGISEKEVQTAVMTPSDDDSGIQVDEREKKCKQNLVDEYISKETQTGLLSITTRRLAAYRKQSSRKCQNEQPGGKKLDSNCSSSITPHSVTVAAGSSKVCNSMSPSVHLNKNTRPPGNMLDNSDLTGHETEGKMKVWSKSLMKIYPRGTTERRFFCEPCGKGYKKKSHLERHVRVHTGERPFQCSHCEKRFAVRSILKQHVRTHTGEKPYCCTVCQQRFPQKSGLMTHTMLHTGKPFKCDRCEKAFVSNHKLLQHVKSHGGPRKYVCATCSTEFFTEGALLQHKQTHNRKSPSLCMICGKSFHQEKYLKFHLDQHLQKLSSIDSPT